MTEMLVFKPITPRSSERFRVPTVRATGRIDVLQLSSRTRVVVTFVKHDSVETPTHDLPAVEFDDDGLPTFGSTFGAKSSPSTVSLLRQRMARGATRTWRPQRPAR